MMNQHSILTVKSIDTIEGIAAMKVLHGLRENYTQYKQKLNVWADIFRDRIIEPFFFDGNLDGLKYLELFQEKIVPAI